jgi:hypothetical protein
MLLSIIRSEVDRTFRRLRSLYSLRARSSCVRKRPIVRGISLSPSSVNLLLHWRGNKGETKMTLINLKPGLMLEIILFR